MNGIRIGLAAKRAEPLIVQLTEHRNDPKAQRQALTAAPCMRSAIGWTGGAFDLAVLLEDPAFRVPGRSRSETEQMIADATSRVEAVVARDRREASRSRWATVGMLGAGVAFLGAGAVLVAQLVN